MTIVENQKHGSVNRVYNYTRLSDKSYVARHDHRGVHLRQIQRIIFCHLATKDKTMKRELFYRFNIKTSNVTTLVRGGDHSSQKSQNSKVANAA